MLSEHYKPPFIKQDTTLVQLMNELIDVCTLGVCFEVHRSLRLGNWQLLEDHQEDEDVDDQYGNHACLDFYFLNLFLSGIMDFNYHSVLIIFFFSNFSSFYS